MVEMFGLVESYRRKMTVRLRFLDQFELEMSGICPHLATVAVVIDIFRQEYGRRISRSERLELLQNPDEFGSDGIEIQTGIHIYHRSQHFRSYPVADKLLYPAAEFRKILFLQRQSGSIKVASEILQKIGTVFYGIIQVETVHTSRGPRDQTVGLGFGKDYGRLVERLHQTGSHNTDCRRWWHSRTKGTSRTAPFPEPPG